MKIIDSRMRKLGDQLGTSGGKPGILLVAKPAGGWPSIWIREFRSWMNAGS
jgi:hypothetical protein